jgi:hypothetical protein
LLRSMLHLRHQIWSQRDSGNPFSGDWISECGDVLRESPVIEEGIWR